jgi:hypothetical protein
MLHPDKWDTSQFTHEFTFSVIAWNHLEFTSKSLLSALLGNSPASWLVTSEMQNVSLANGIASCAIALGDIKLEAKIKHFIAGIEKLRNSRNFWMHGLVGVVPESEQSATCAGSISQIQAKGNVRHNEIKLTVKILGEFIESARLFRQYGQSIINEIAGENTWWKEFREGLGLAKSAGQGRS